MSKERGLLNLCAVAFKARNICPFLLTEISELLAQPKQDNIQYLLDQVARLTAENAMLKEKWSTPKREPLTPQQISAGNQSMLNVTREAFKQGVIFAEKHHGIGVDDE